MTALRLRWRKTWPHKANDFYAEVPSGSCRIYRAAHTATMPGQEYYWCANAETRAIGSGYEPTARAAAAAAERCYFGEDRK